MKVFAVVLAVLATAVTAENGVCFAGVDKMCRSADRNTVGKLTNNPKIMVHLSSSFVALLQTRGTIGMEQQCANNRSRLCFHCQLINIHVDQHPEPVAV